MTSTDLYNKPWAKLIANACNKHDIDELRSVLLEMGAERLVLLHKHINLEYIMHLLLQSTKGVK